MADFLTLILRPHSVKTKAGVWRWYDSLRFFFFPFGLEAFPNHGTPPCIKTTLVWQPHRYLCCSILREDEGVDVTHGDHVQDGAPAALQGSHHQRAEVKTEEGEGVFRRRGEALDGDGQLQTRIYRINGQRLMKQITAAAEQVNKIKPYLLQGDPQRPEHAYMFTKNRQPHGGAVSSL